MGWNHHLVFPWVPKKKGPVNLEMRSSSDQQKLPPLVGWIRHRGWVGAVVPTQLNSGIITSAIFSKDPFINQRVFHGSCFILGVFLFHEMLAHLGCDLYRLSTGIKNSRVVEPFRFLLKDARTPPKLEMISFFCGKRASPHLKPPCGVAGMNDVQRQNMSVTAWFHHDCRGLKRVCQVWGRRFVLIIYRFSWATPIFPPDEILKKSTFQGRSVLWVLFVRSWEAIFFCFTPSNDFVEQPKIPHPVCVFCGGWRWKILPCVSLIGDFSCRNLSLWNSSPSDETPVCWLKSLKGEGWKGHQTVVFSAGCRIQVVRGQTLVASVFTKYIT